MRNHSTGFAFLGVFFGLLAALALSAFTGGCASEVSASAPPIGWQCHPDGTCSRVAATPSDALDGEDEGGEELPAVTVAPRKRAALMMPEALVFGCVPVDEPGRVTFCDEEGTALIVANGEVVAVE